MKVQLEEATKSLDAIIVVKFKFYRFSIIIKTAQVNE